MTETDTLVVPPGSTIYPTQHCFDDAMDFLEQIAREGATREEVNQYTLVHAICLHPQDGHRFAHAWLERDGKVIDSGILNGDQIYYEVDQAHHYAKLRVQESKKYSMLEALTENHKHMTFGPWEQRFLDLCAENLLTPAHGADSVTPSSVSVEAGHEQKLDQC